jgi:hypothetical protein
VLGPDALREALFFTTSQLFFLSLITIALCISAFFAHPSVENESAVVNCSCTCLSSNLMDHRGSTHLQQWYVTTRALLNAHSSTNIAQQLLT